MASTPEHNDANCFVGIDLGGTLLKSALVDANGKVRTFHKDLTNRESAPGLINQLADVVSRLREETSSARIEGVGIGVPGNVDFDTKEILHSPNLKFTEGIKVMETLERKIGLTVAVDNDANAAGLGEFRFGAGRGTRNMVFIGLGTGVGGGLVLDRKVFRGSKGFAAELGHTLIKTGGERCNCGAVGCLETEASAHAVGRKAREAVAAGADTILAAIKDREITSRDVGMCAEQGDALSISVLRDAGMYLGIAIANFVNIFNPDVVIVGGGVATSGEFLLAAAIKEAGARAFRAPFEHCRYVLAELGDMAGVLGAAALAMEWE